VKEGQRRIAPLLVLAGAFAGFVQMCVVLAGLVPAGALAAALAAGALVITLLAAPRPLAALRTLDRAAAFKACLAGLLAVAGAPALIASLRLSDAPAGSIVVFWVAGGWAAIAACAAAALALKARSRVSAAWSVSGALLVLAGAAGVVADWERPSSFSPLVRFAPRELGILLGGVLLLAGGLMLVRIARTARMDGALICASGSALAVSLAWWVASGFAHGWQSLAERPIAVVVAAVAWGVVCGSWPVVLKTWGPAPAAAALSVTPVLLSALILLEQFVGVAGPQPLVVTGVASGSLLLVAAAVALLHAPSARSAPSPRWILVAGAVPAVLAAVALALPAIVARAEVSVTEGVFTASWSLPGVESVAGWAAVALAVLVIVVAADARPAWPAAAALAACAAWPWLLDVPSHVWTASLAPEVQQYYGTEYGTISFTAQPGAPMIGAIGLTAVVMLAVIALRRGVRPGADSLLESGGS
jgi:hypothetical protein